MGKRCIYGPKGESVVIDDKAEIPKGWGVDPQIVAREKEAARQAAIAETKTSKKKTSKKSN